MISKELLSEVLGKKVVFVELEETNTINAMFGIDGKLINIYELSHKCKEWAFDKGYALLSGIDNKTFEVPKTVCTANYKLYNSWSYKCFYADTETETIFKACEWIMEQNK